MIETIYNIISQYILLPLTIAVFPVDYQTEAMLFFQTTIKILAIVVPVMIADAYFTYAERKVIGFIQGRIGPNRVGLFGFRLWGLGQPIADAVKLIAKEIFKNARNDSKDDKDFINKFIDNLGLSLSLIINIIDPDAIVFGGGVSNEIHSLEEVKNITEKYLKNFNNLKNVNLRTVFLKPKYGDASGVRGAALLGRKQIY